MDEEIKSTFLTYIQTTSNKKKIFRKVFFKRGEEVNRMTFIKLNAQCLTKLPFFIRGFVIWQN